MRTKVFMAGSFLALLLILGSRVAFAQGTGDKSRRNHVPSDLAAEVAERLHLSTDDIDAIKAEIAGGKSVKQVLLDHGITLDQIRTALGYAGKHHHRLSNTELISIAKKLGLDPDKVQAEIESGKSFRDILRTHDVSAEKIREAFGDDFKHKNSSFNKKRGR